MLKKAPLLIALLMAGINIWVSLSTTNNKVRAETTTESTTVTVIIGDAAGGSCAVCNNARTSTELDLLVAEAGEAYGVPGSVLLGILLHEGWHPQRGSKHVLDFTDQEVLDASREGGRDPWCVRNGCYCAGPFQLSTNPNQFTDIKYVGGGCTAWQGVDHWSTFGQAAIESGARPPGYQTHPCNLKDAAYAAAAHVRDRAGWPRHKFCPKKRTPPLNCEDWDEDDARYAYCTYQGTCRNNYCDGSYGFLTKYSCQ